MRLRPLQGSTRHGPPTSTAPAAPKSNNCGYVSYSHGVFYPTTLKPERVYSTPVCHTDYVPPSGFRTLSTAFSSLERPALFHAGNAHGFLPFRDFPSLSGPTGSSPGKYPLDVSPPQCTVSSALRGTRFSANPITSPRHEPLPPPGLCSDSESVPLLDCYIRMQTADPLLSFSHLSRVLPNDSRPRHASRVPLLRFDHLFLEQPNPEQARNRPQKRRGALQRLRPKTPDSAPRSENPLLRFSWPFRFRSSSEE